MPALSFGYSNLGKRLKFYEMTSADDIYTTEYSVGFGIIDGTGYLVINISWIALEFSIKYNTANIRIKYGSNAWSSWKNIY